jgi:DNA-binding Xre family transcriptional regulator
MAITGTQRHQIKKFVKELAPHKGRHTELVTVYIPADYEMTKVIQQLSQEQGTATNIKSASTRKNVQAALERMIQHLRLYKRTPEHGLAAFSGNVAEREGQSDVQVWSIEPPEPLNIRIYRCDKQFILEPLEDMCDIKEVYGLIVMDRRDACIALLKGKKILPLQKTHSEVPGKHKTGGQCLVKETLIQSCDGAILQIKASHNPQVLKTMMIKDFSLTDSPITDKWNVKKSHIYKITTKSPQLEVQASKDHVFFVRTENGIKERSAEELQEGDYLIMPEKINITGSIQTINAVQYYNSFSINEEGRSLLQKRRMEKNLLQKELAEQLGMTKVTISRYELGKSHAGRVTLQKVCAALKHIHKTPFTQKYKTTKSFGS